VSAGPTLVVAGLPSAGKTTVCRLLAERMNGILVPEHNDWIGGSENFPPAPRNHDEKIAKQEFFLNIDLARGRWSAERRTEGELVLSDSDFLAPLAHNFAERWLLPELDIYAWMVETYGKLLKEGALAPADAYVYLDVPLEERERRRRLDSRVRADFFFEEPFASNMRLFYDTIFRGDADLNAAWLPHDASVEVEVERAEEAARRLLAESRPTEVDRLVAALERSVDVIGDTRIPAGASRPT
jgi:deoxyadenosine/deoxycytidine kinase